jgi:hypothetical protein
MSYRGLQTAYDRPPDTAAPPDLANPVSGALAEAASAVTCSAGVRGRECSPPAETDK